MAGSGELLLPLSMATTCASKRDANTPMTTNHRKTILHVRLSWHKSQADNKAKMNDWDRPKRAVPMGRLKFEKKRKLGPTDRQSGSVQTMTLPRHADKDCLTTEENLTITSSRITRQGRCRCGAAASSLVTRNHQPTQKRLRPQRTTGDTRIFARWNLWANVTDDENEWRTAQWRCKAGRALADSWRQRKKKGSGMSEHAKYVRESHVSSTGARRRGQQHSADSAQNNISVNERKRDAAARRCLDGTDVLSKDRKIGSL